jgi:hypothetical protein
MLTFRCKPPSGASSPYISAVSALTFRCKPPSGATSPSISAVFGSAFPKERLLSRKLTLRSLRNGFLWLRRALHPLRDVFRASPCFFFSLCTRWCVLSFYIYIFGGYCSCRAEIRKKITCYGPIKNLSPPLERKRVP